MVQTAISGTIILYQRQSPITPPEFIPYYIGRGMFGMGGVTCLYYGFAVLPIADATALYYTLPIPTAIFAWVFLGESYGGVEVLAAMTGLLGVFCITRPPFLWPFPSPSHHDPTLDVLPEDHSPAEVNLGYVACLCGALLTSMAFITIRRVGKRTTAWVLTFWHGVSGVGVCGVLMVVLQQLKMPDSWEHLALLASVGVFALLVQVLVNKGLQLEAAGPGALMTNLQLVWAYLLQVTFQHKPIIGWCVFGAVLIVSATAGTFLYNSYRDKHVQSDRSALKRTKSAEMSVLSIEAPQQGDDEYQQI
ncbi:hypothetical protein SARC_06747 [Sphaeroforma arctica JP610]|uniref:EamA domain-containing protein n=1 Tax=Sphaeroforma arctica JP610 TaxID=667725 RepID=A0A0L0FWG0_9EUKA|nr:hypothetical protein SARC_06747 [Sphaeroforma arctica JP610]KNC80906.1 hypothetical protein SARC_06747 [Sphaeroforma arctica JP610]|eukprot:XP_014154808.1 hypothetical protein SARC_06747 [Sphaeroforma arctica JP610]